MSRLWAIFASGFTFAVTTIGCVLIFFKSIAEGDTPGQPWPTALAILVYVAASAVLHDWLSRNAVGSYKAAVALGGAQGILIIDLLARGERGFVAAMAGLVMLVITWGSLAAVHAWMTRPRP